MQYNCCCTDDSKTPSTEYIKSISSVLDKETNVMMLKIMTNTGEQIITIPLGSSKGGTSERCIEALMTEPEVWGDKLLMYFTDATELSTSTNYSTDKVKNTTTDSHIKDYSGLKEVLDAMANRIWYEAIKLKTFTLKEASQEYEVGQIIKSLTFTWEYSKNPAKQVITRGSTKLFEEVVETGLTASVTTTISGLSITSNTSTSISYTLTITEADVKTVDTPATASKSISIVFKSPYYTGLAAPVEVTSIDSKWIKDNLTKTLYSNWPSLDVTVKGNTQGLFYYVISRDNLKFKSLGVEFSPTSTVVPFTNDAGITFNMNVYKMPYVYTADTLINITKG